MVVEAAPVVVVKSGGEGELSYLSPQHRQHRSLCTILHTHMYEKSCKAQSWVRSAIMKITKQSTTVIFIKNHKKCSGEFILT